MEAKFQHLQFIQGVINRLAADSFRVKGWSVVLVAALLALMVREGQVGLALIGVIPIAFLWALDGYFLWQERLFRALYDHVRTQEEGEIDFSMNVEPFQTNHKRTWQGATLSLTLLLFYGALMLALLLALVVVALVN